MKILALMGLNGAVLYVNADNIATFYEFFDEQNAPVGTIIFMVGTEQGIGVAISPETLADMIASTLQ